MVFRHNSYQDVTLNATQPDPNIHVLALNCFLQMTTQSSFKISSDKSKTESAFTVGRMTKSRMIIIDVRSPSEFKRGALPDSINIPLSKAFNTEELGNYYMF